MPSWRTYVKAHPDRFSTPEYREIEYAAIAPQDVAGQVTVTDQMIADEYQEPSSRIIIVPEKRDIQQIEFANEADAKAARDKIASGAVTFEALAAERKIQARRPDAGHARPRPTWPIQARADAAFSLPVNQVSQPVKGAINGYVLHPGDQDHAGDFRIRWIEVKDQIKQQLALQLAGAKITDMVNAFEDARSGGADIATAAKKAGMNSGRIAAVDTQRPCPRRPESGRPAVRSGIPCRRLHPGSGRGQ